MNSLAHRFGFRIALTIVAPAVMALVCLDQLANGAVSKAWVRRYSNSVSNAQDVAAAVLRDAAGNVIVAGYTYDGFERPAMLLLKYSGGNGSLLWQARHEGVDLIAAAAVDAHGNVAVAGYTSNAEDWDFFTAKYSADGVLLWTRRYDGPSDDKAVAVAFDASGNVVVTGGSSQDDYRNDDDGLTRYDYYTAKYAAADGALLWERRYNGPGNGRDLAQAMVIDASDNVVVAGASYGGESSLDYYTVKYAGADGALIWEQRYTGPRLDDVAQAVALDAAGNVVVTGYSWSSDWYTDAHTIKYAAADGAVLWQQRYNGPANRDDAAQAVAVDGSGNVVITGHSTDNMYYYDAYTAKYAAADGALLWERLYGPMNRSASGQALAVDASGNVVMTGYSLSNRWDHYTAKYAATDGALLWERRQDGPRFGDIKSAVVLDASGNAVVTGGVGPYDPDIHTAKYAATDGSMLWEQRYGGVSRDQGVGQCVAVDVSGNVFVSGSSEGEDSFFDYYTAKYAPNGTLLWDSRYDGPGLSYDFVRAMALDADGNVIVTGSSSGTNASDFYTVKYAASDGAVLWEQRYDGPENWADYAYAVAVDGSGNVIVTGYSHGRSTPAVYYTAKYAAASGALLWERRFSTSTGHASAYAVAVDASGNVLVAGSSDVVKYAATDGALLWNRPFTGDGLAVKVDANGDVVVTGQGSTAKYASADGALLWQKRVAGAALALDAHGNAILTGSSYDDDGNSVHTFKYASANGALLWERRYDDPSNSFSQGRAVAVDQSGNVVVAGFASNGRNDDYFTAKYAAADGAVLWEQLHDGGREDRVESRCGLALGPNGMVAITGVADGYPGGAYGYGITTVVYREAISIALIPAGVRLRFLGDPGRRYTIQRAPAITGPWDTLATPEAPANGQIEHLDSAPLPNGAFYRTTQP